MLMRHVRTPALASRNNNTYAIFYVWAFGPPSKIRTRILGIELRYSSPLSYRRVDLVDVLGFEPRLAASEADVLPLYDTSMVLSTRIELVFWLYQSHVLNLYTMRGWRMLRELHPHLQF